MRTITLSAVECRVIRSALASALAGDPSVGDFCWTFQEEAAAHRVMEKLTTVPSRGSTRAAPPSCTP